MPTQNETSCELLFEMNFATEKVAAKEQFSNEPHQLVSNPKLGGFGPVLKAEKAAVRPLINVGALELE